MTEQVLQYHGHHFTRTRMGRYDSWTWYCERCGHISSFLRVIIERNEKILSCNERIIKRLLE